MCIKPIPGVTENFVVYCNIPSVKYCVCYVLYCHGLYNLCLFELDSWQKSNHKSFD